MNTIARVLLPAALLAASVLAAPAQAQVTFSLTPPVLGGVNGDTLHFTGVLTNTGPDPVFLNNDSLTFNAPVLGLTTNDTPFFDGTPTGILAPAGQVGSAYSGGFFDVTLNGAMPGTYSGTFVILGGADANALEPVASQGFQVIVPASAPVPEASTAASLALLLVLAGFGVVRRRRAV